jgi:hypothetical protein
MADLPIEKDGYKIWIVDGVNTLEIDDTSFDIMIDRYPAYKILCRKSDGEKFLRTNDVFGHITEVSETSKGDAAIKFTTLPDEFSGLMIKDRIVITP